MQIKQSDSSCTPGPVRVLTISLGCPKNRVDTENMLGQLGGAYRPASEAQEADVVLVNTCAFIQPAVEESVQAILHIAHEFGYASKRPLLAVTGCLPARYGVTELSQELPEVDLWLSLQEQPLFAHRLASYFDLPLPSSSRLLTTPPGYAYLKVSEGCEHKCAFCTIPAIRGRLRSVPLGEVQREAMRLRDRGVRELCLVAQDLSAYGRDLGWGNSGLCRLLETLFQVSGVDWIRLMYLYPTGLSRELLQFISQAGAPLLPYIDVPLQHAHPDVLRRMGRPFVNDPQRVVDRVYELLPQACLRTSLIVGYPGETEAHFQTLLNFIHQVRFWHLGVFAFSPEEGTPAARLPGQVPDHVQEHRRAEIMRLQADISREIMSGFVGQTLPVLIDAPEPEWPALYQGRAWFQAPEVDGITYVSSQEAGPGDMVQAEVVDSMTYDLSALALEAGPEEVKV
ncbi:MAG: 30S ribosomal protein S12 methylthiotransferase RimO [Desulfovermiculus sp.]|nr:30S ribosomal protein S12 methylthiotransferase RimO [Desulfovermiculus sp.]